MKTKKVKAWAVLNLGGKNMTWGFLEQYQRLPLFLRKKAAEKEKKRLDAEKPARIAGLERTIVRGTFTYEYEDRDFPFRYRKR